MSLPDEIVYYAHRVERPGGPVYLHASPRRWWVVLHGLPDPVVALRLREWREGDPPCRYWAWVYAKRPEEYTFVWPSRGQVSICFPDGVEVAESRGVGRLVRLHVEEVQNNA